MTTTNTVRLAGIDVNPATIGDLTITQLTHIYNSVRPEGSKPLVKFKDKPTALERLKPLLVQHFREEHRQTEEKPETVIAKPAAKADKAEAEEKEGKRRSPMARTCKIKILHANPKKPGSKAAERWTKLANLPDDKRTVGEAYELGVTAEDLRYGVKMGQLEVVG